MTKYYVESTSTEGNISTEIQLHEQHLTLIFTVKPQTATSSPQHVLLASPKHPKSASNATRELDDLMASLSDFKVFD